MPDPKVSYFENGWIGLHLTLNPTPALAPTAQVYRRFLQNGIRLNDSERQSLLAGRAEGIATMDRILGTGGPSMGASTRLNISAEIVDAIFARGIDAHLAREAPTGLDMSDERGDKTAHALNPAFEQVGTADRLLRLVPPVGLSLTIHFR